jgi:hypothetical protein
MLSSREGQNRRCRMKLALFTIRCIVALFAIVFVSSVFLFAQEAGKQKLDPKRAILEQMHPSPIEAEPPQGVRLLAGYKHKAATDFEGTGAGEIWKDGGLKIRYEMGLSQGQAVEPNERGKYLWYREQIVNGRVVRFALTKKKMLMITIPLDNTPNTWHAANFYGEIKRSEDIAEMLLMILPFAY